MDQITNSEWILLAGLFIGLAATLMLGKTILKTKREFKAEIDYMKTELRSKKIYFLGTSMETIFKELRAKTQAFPDKIFELGRLSNRLDNSDWGNNLVMVEVMQNLFKFTQDMSFDCNISGDGIPKLLDTARSFISNEVDFEFKTLRKFLHVKEMFGRRLSEWDSVLESVDKFKKEEEEE